MYRRVLTTRGPYTHIIREGITFSHFEAKFNCHLFVKITLLDLNSVADGTALQKGNISKVNEASTVQSHVTSSDKRGDVIKSKTTNLCTLPGYYQVSTRWLRF